MRIALIAVVVCSLSACKKKEEPASSPSPATPSAPSATAPASGTAAPAPTPVSGEAVDTCAMVAKEQVEVALAGQLEGEPEKMPAQGSLLGMCSWNVGDLSGSISARPANEFEATARDGKEVAALGEKAMMTKHGLMVKVAGKPYFLHVMVIGMKGNDEAKSIELAKAAVAGIK